MGMRDELRRSGESCGKMEAVWGEFGAIGPAFGQRTNDDDEYDTIITLIASILISYYF